MAKILFSRTGLKAFDPSETLSRKLTAYGMLAVWLLALLGSCQSKSPRRDPSPAPDNQQFSSEVGPPVDAAPGDSDFDVQQVAEWDVRPEPASVRGNQSPYQVLGKQYEVTVPAAHFTQTGLASWYGRKFHGRLTSNQETFDMYRFTAAHRSLPLPSFVKVTNLKNGRSLVVRVNDRGPFKPGRIIDLSWAAAKKLGYVNDGVTKVRIELVQAPTGLQDQATQNGLLFLQVGAFSNEQKAKSIAKRISLKTGAKVHISQVDNGSTRLHRVRVGPLADQPHVERIRQALQPLGFKHPRLVVE
jgi:rare lipoprotein A